MASITFHRLHNSLLSNHTLYKVLRPVGGQSQVALTLEKYLNFRGWCTRHTYGPYKVLWSIEGYRRWIIGVERKLEFLKFSYGPTRRSVDGPTTIGEVLGKVQRIEKLGLAGRVRFMDLIPMYDPYEPVPKWGLRHGKLI